jgi:hypothetical protein
MQGLTSFALLGLLISGVASVAANTDAYAGGSGDAVTVQVTGSPLSNIRSSPLSLTPVFANAITDYVWRCQSGTNKIQVTFTAISGGTITVDGNTGPIVAVQESLIENQALIVSAPDPSNPKTAVQYWIRCLPHDFLGVARSRRRIRGVRLPWPQDGERHRADRTRASSLVQR